ncbi:MAG: hypothetical protein KUG56_00685 [Kordiimonadaceae bacterium]|nr:hypothetical protein [Kordiimonadaceae bacterium]
MLNNDLSSKYRLAIASRIGAAVMGGYIFAVIVPDFLSASLHTFAGISQAEALNTGLTLSFFIYLIAILVAFAVETATKAWLWILGGCFLFGSLSYAIDGGIPS